MTRKNITTTIPSHIYEKIKEREYKIQDLIKVGLAIAWHNPDMFNIIVKYSWDSILNKSFGEKVLFHAMSGNNSQKEVDLEKIKSMIEKIIDKKVEEKSWEFYKKEIIPLLERNLKYGRKMHFYILSLIVKLYEGKLTEDEVKEIKEMISIYNSMDRSDTSS